MKKLLFLFAILLVANFVNSQEHLGNRFGLHTGMYIPNDEFLAVYNNGYGANLSGKFQVSRKLAITVEIGFYTFEKKFDSLGLEQAKILGFSDSFVNTLGLFPDLQDLKIEVPSGHLMPVNLGVEYQIFHARKVRPYVGLNVGLYTVHTKAVDFNFNEILKALPAGSLPPLGNGIGNIEFDATDLNFGVGTVVGVAYMLSNRFSLDLSGKYHFLIAPDKDAAVRFLNINFGLVSYW